MHKKIPIFPFYLWMIICTSCGGNALSPTDSDKSNEKSKLLTDLSNDPSSPEDFQKWFSDEDESIKLTVDAIRTSVGASSCIDVGKVYLERGNKTLMLYAPGISNLRPLSAFRDLKLLGIQHSAVSDYSPLSILPLLDTLIVSADGSRVSIRFSSKIAAQVSLRARSGTNRLCRY